MTIDAQKYDKIARTVFAPVFPLIADQIIAYTGVTQGTCLDIGCGGGYLGAALADKTDLFVRLFDTSPDMLEVAKRTIAENKLIERADTLQGDVTAIPLPDNTIDLAVSRGSIFFWDDLPRALTDYSSGNYARRLGLYRRRLRIKGDNRIHRLRDEKTQSRQ